MVPKYQARVIAKTRYFFECVFARYLEQSDIQCINNHYSLMPRFKTAFVPKDNELTVHINENYSIDDALLDYKELLNSIGFEKIYWTKWNWIDNKTIDPIESEDLEKVLAAK